MATIRVIAAYALTGVQSLNSQTSRSLYDCSGFAPSHGGNSAEIDPSISSAMIGVSMPVRKGQRCK